MEPEHNAAGRAIGQVQNLQPAPPNSADRLKNAEAAHRAALEARIQDMKNELRVYLPDLVMVYTSRDGEFRISAPSGSEPRDMSELLLKGVDVLIPQRANRT